MSEPREEKFEEKFRLPPIEPVAEVWEPSPSPDDIVIPGLDTTASTQDQIEQLDQLITIRLQNIDANFARANQILQTKILPAVRRYAVNTEPVREAARFWVSFFEQAAQVRIPGTDDFDEEEQQQYVEDDGMEDRHTEEAAVHDDDQGDADAHRTFDPNVTPSESSFTPDALVSSTPMVGVQASQRGGKNYSQDTPSSWEASIESPFDRLDKGLRSLGHDTLNNDADSVIGHSRSHNQSAFEPGSAYDDDNLNAESSSHSSRAPVFTAAQSKGKGKAQQPSLLQSVLAKNLGDALAPGSPARKKPTSPLKVRQKTPKRANPYARSEAARARWDGIVDLSKRDASGRAAGNTLDEYEDEREEEEEERTFQLQDVPAFSAKPTHPSRFATQVGQTPVREAAARIGRDLVGRAAQARQPPLFSRGWDAEGGGGVAEPDSPDSIPSPKLSIYSRRLLGLESEESQSSMASTSASISAQSRSGSVSVSDSVHGDTSKTSEVEQPSLRGMMRQFGLQSDSYASSFAGSDAGGTVRGDPEDSFEDSFDDDTPAPPVFASLALQGARAGEDDGDSDSDSDSDLDMMDDGAGGGGMGASDDTAGAGGGGARDAPIHPFARGFSADTEMNDDSFDDSFDDGPGRGGEEEGTLFGVGVAEQYRQQQQQYEQQQRGGAGTQLQLLGRDLVDDTTALNERLNTGIGNVPDTPTPWVDRERSS